MKKCFVGMMLAFFVMAGVISASFPAYAEEEMKAVFGMYLYGKGWDEGGTDNRYRSAPADSYVTAMKASLRNQPQGMTGTIIYQVNLSGSGWLDWQENYGQAGSADTNKPLEAVRMELTGQLTENFDLYYSVFQNGSWTDLVMNGETAGQEGCGLRVDGIRIAVTAKGAGAPPEPEPEGRVIDPSKPMVALTFDDGPSRYTAGILDVLEANDAKATFFMVGNRMGSYPDTVKRMVELGWDHTYITSLSGAALKANLDRVDQTLASIAGVHTVIMRPPGGYINNAARTALAEKGVPAVFWSIDTLDWKTKNAGQTVNTVLSKVRDGDIILMHDLYGASAEAAATLIPELINRGYQLVTVSELASFRGGMQPGQSYHYFRP